MKFEELTAEYIMSQPWHVRYDWLGGICVKHEDDEFPDCVILSPNDNFVRTGIYQPLCEQVCKEHNERLEQAAFVPEMILLMKRITKDQCNMCSFQYGMRADCSTCPYGEAIELIDKVEGETT